MSWLTMISLNKRWLTFLVAALVTLASIWAVVTLRMELIPDIELPVTSVMTVYPRAAPDEVMTRVTVPVEKEISDIGGLKHLISTSVKNMSFVLAEFEFGTDMDKVNSTISQNLAELSLPPEARQPQLFPINLSMMPLVIFSLSGDLPPDELQEIAASRIVPQLEAIDGVYHIGVEGGSLDKVLVSLDPGEMNRFGISTAQVAALLAAQEYSSLNQINGTPLGFDTLVLEDVAQVEKGPAPGTAITRTNGQPSITIMVIKEAEANTVEVANAVVDEAESIADGLGDEVTLLTVMDQSEFIEESIGELTQQAIIGGVLAIIVIFLFLMAFRASLITAISIPLSLLIGFLVMRLWGITINLLTLSAMAIAVGRLIDNSIVVLEVIYRRLEQGEGFREAAINGSKEVASPITSSTLATVAIFLPLAFVGGIVGELFVPFALTITFALIASLLVALMVVPALSSFMVPKKARGEAGETWYQRAYAPVLKWALSHRALTLIIAAVLFFGSLGLLPIIGTTFLPSTTEKMLTVEVEMPPGTDLGTTAEKAKQVEEFIATIPNKQIYSTTVGTSSSVMGGFGTLMGAGDNTASVMVYLTPDADLEKEAAALRRACELIAEEGTITVSTAEPMMAGMGASGLMVTIQGQNSEDVARVTEQLLAGLEEVDGLVNLEADIARVVPELEIKPDMALGLSPAELERLQGEFRLMMMGGTVAQAALDGRTHDVFVNGVARGLDSVAEAEALRVGWPRSVALGDIATVELVERPTHVRRIDQRPSATIEGNITAKDVGAVNEAVQERIDALTLPSGVEIKMGGIAEEMAETFSGMGIAIIVAIVIAYLVMVLFFRSFLNPLIIMVSLPLASIGALLALLISGQPLGASALMGVLMLVGIVLTNAIVLIALVEQLRKGGLGTYDALVEGGRTRLRPILMTALTTMIALFPLALGLGAGVLLAAELATVVIGGLFSSTLLTLVVIPVIYSLVQGRRRRAVKEET